MIPQGGLRHVDRWSDQSRRYRDEHYQRNRCPKRSLNTHHAATGKEPHALLPGCKPAGRVTGIHLPLLEPDTHKEQISFSDC
jgi:hypothetical protein